MTELTTLGIEAACSQLDRFGAALHTCRLLSLLNVDLAIGQPSRSVSEPTLLR
jgi:hypothetical protein